VKQGTPCLMMPAFSLAMRSSVSPSSSMWSKPRLVIPVSRGGGSGGGGISGGVGVGVGVGGLKLLRVCQEGRMGARVQDGEQHKVAAQTPAASAHTCVRVGPPSLTCMNQPHSHEQAVCVRKAHGRMGCGVADIQSCGAMHARASPRPAHLRPLCA
jgi:hypothetical protein